jgi:hypothetical protein
MIFPTGDVWDLPSTTASFPRAAPLSLTLFLRGMLAKTK